MSKLLLLLILLLNMMNTQAVTNQEATVIIQETSKQVENSMQLIGNLIKGINIAQMFEDLQKLNDEAAILSKEALEKINDASKKLETMSVDHHQLNTIVANIALKLKLETSNILPNAVKYNNPDGELTDTGLQVWTVYLKKYIRTLYTASQDLQDVVDQLAKLEHESSQYKVDTQGISVILEHDRDTQSDQMKALIQKKRAEVYGGCAACLALPPACIVCYGVAVGVIEGKFVKEVQKSIDNLNNMINSNLQTLATLEQAFELAQQQFNEEKNAYQQYSTELEFYSNDLGDLQQLVLIDVDFRNQSITDMEAVQTIAEDLYDYANSHL